MSIDHVLAVVPVSDIDSARAFYALLLGRAPDNHPMDTLVEWRVTDSGWLQVTLDAGRAGHTLLNLAVDDLPAHVDALAARGLSVGAIETVNKGVRLCPIDDPDGNRITLIGDFRVDY